MAASAQEALPIEEQGAHPTAGVDPNTTSSAPRVITFDKNAAYPKPLRISKPLQVKYPNNLIEQDHRFLKRLVKPALGFLSFQTAGERGPGCEGMNMIRKGQVQAVGKGNSTGQVSFIASLFGVAA